MGILWRCIRTCGMGVLVIGMGYGIPYIGGYLAVLYSFEIVLVNFGLTSTAKIVKINCEASFNDVVRMMTTRGMRCS
jgi:hypothetical protein